MKPKPIPPIEILEAGATRLIRDHFAAINGDDVVAFRSTSFIFPPNDGKPFQFWWTEMRNLAPLVVDCTFLRARDTISMKPLPHVNCWVNVVAHSGRTGLKYQSDFVVWFLTEENTWKLGCRIHWGTPSPT